MSHVASPRYEVFTSRRIEINDRHTYRCIPTSGPTHAKRTLDPTKYSDFTVNAIACTISLYVFSLSYLSVLKLRISNCLQTGGESENDSVKSGVSIKDKISRLFLSFFANLTSRWKLSGVVLVPFPISSMQSMQSTTSTFNVA